MPSQELLNIFNIEIIIEKILQYDCTYIDEFIIFLWKIMNNTVDFCTKNQCSKFFKNIHFQLIDIVVYKKHPPDHKNLLPQILYQTLYLSQCNLIENKFKNIKDQIILPIKIDETNNNGINIVHFISLEEKLKLPSDKYDRYCLQIHMGKIKCLQFEKNTTSTHIIDSIENICDLCYHHNEINIEALKLLRECISIITKEQWTNLSKSIYKVIMGLMNHHLPSIHNQCMLLFKKCLDLEDLDFILKIVMTEISWSLRIKFYMLAVIASKYSVKKIFNQYDILSISMWKCLSEPYLLSPSISFYKICIKDLDENDFITLVMQPIIHYLITNNNISELTIYNFVTYLLPEIKFKHINSLLLLYENINNQSKPDLYLQVSVLRIIYNYNTEVENYQKVLNLSLTSSNPKIRIVAFTILSHSKITTNTLNLIYNFIVDNINSDYSTLRIKLISGLENILRKCKIHNNTVLQFLYKLHKFILINLRPGSNYQRKITSLKIYSVILRYNKNLDFVSFSCRNLLFTNLLDSEDIRNECSSILVKYFIIVGEDQVYLNNWLKLGLNLCYDPLFYKNESGSIIIITVVKLMYKCGLTIDMLNINNSSVSAYILDLVQKQGDKLKVNFINNVMNSTFYGLLSTLNNLSFEKNAPEINMLNETEIEIMLNLIENNLSLLLDTLASRTEGKTEAPSFAQMDNALSSLRKTNQDSVHLPTNEFLLNFIWINIKICCDVASKYAVMLAISNIFDKEYQNIQIKRCADMIADVLIRCRHKGAMEATCKSLGVLIKHWTESQDWCQNMLSNHISCMKPEDEISRRSAGVRYLIHAIVTNNKNTVKDCIKQLFNIAKDDIYINNDTIVDLPQARAQHLLTAIVSNASISTDSLYFCMEDLIMLCIDKLNSPLWTIRNAALQFFSSLQIRLIGQNRLNNNFWLSHLPLEPLLYNFPNLMQRLQFLWSQTNSKLSSQTHLIPFMSLLKGVKLQSWTLLPLEHREFLKKLRCSLWSIGFTLEIYTVRNMAAQAYANTIPTTELSSTLNKISNEIIKFDNEGVNSLEFKCSNHLHGLMLLYKYLKDLYFMEFNQDFDIFNIAHENLPPLCKSIYISMNRQVLGTYPSNSTFDHVRVKNLMIENDIFQSTDLSGLIEFYMNVDKHTTISFLKCFKNYNKINNKAIIIKFIHFLDVGDEDIFKEIMMNIDVLVNEKFENNSKVEMETVRFSAILIKCVSYSEKDFIAMLPVLSWLCPTEICVKLLPFIHKYINCDVYDSYDRYKSSKALFYFTDVKDDIRLWNTVIELLQDEDANVRVEVSRYVNFICYNNTSTLNPYLCLRKMFEIKTICSIINAKLAFTCFWELLLDIKLRTEFDEKINPFFNEQSNIYQEHSNIMKLAFKGLKSLIHSNENIEHYREIVKNSLNSLQNECEFKGTFINVDLMILDTYSSLHFLKLYYKREIIMLLNLKDQLDIFSPVLELIYLPTKYLI